MKYVKENTGILFIIILQILAIFLFLIAPGVISSFNQLGLFFGKLFGILGMSLFATSLILSARYKFLDNFFNGLNKVYERHGQIGKTAFYLMLFHPFFIFYAYFGNFDFKQFFNFIKPGPNNIEIGLGTIGLVLIIILISLTIYFRPKYHIWKKTHKFMGLAFFFGGLHAFLVPSDISNFLPLKIYMLSLSGISILSYLYHTVFGFYTTKKYKYIVSEVLDLGENIIEVRLKPAGDKIDFVSGQFAFISFLDKNIGKESHPFSFSSKQDDEIISFTVKNLGDYTSKIKNLQKGTVALIEGPFGKFSYREAVNKKQIWIAGGIGITPFLSMAKSIAIESEYEIDLYYCVRDQKEAVYLQELLNLENPKVKIISHFSDEVGFINSDFIKEQSGLEEKSIFICSPMPMIKSLKNQFKKEGKLNFIHSEEFSL